MSIELFNTFDKELKSENESFTIKLKQTLESKRFIQFVFLSSSGRELGIARFILVLGARWVTGLTISDRLA